MNTERFAAKKLEGVTMSAMDGETFARRALEEAHVAFVPAQAFGGFVRMSYAASRSVIESGLRRLGSWLS